ncbi:MAG: manganese transporter permease [Armatimonadetes bacterium]|jgi:manganese/zinc/iron transport system permease protein|nr:manganese transporter permease [Armatimonadota bacterium]
MWDWLRDSNAQWVLGGCVLLGISSGVLGSLALLRRRSLMGDALAHAALPGVCLAFLITGTRSLGFFLLGALIAGLIGAFCIHAITRYSRIKEDTALGLVLSVFFGFGIVLLTLIQRMGTASQAGLDKFIFGQAASMVGSDVQIMAACAAVVCLAAIVLFKEFKLLCFDPGFARGIGFPTAVLDGLLMLLIVLAVVIGLQAVGVVLMAALLITPAASARLWTDRLSVMVWLSGGFGAISGALGTAASTAAERMPTGPLIVLAATAIFIVSLVFSPRQGILAKALRLLALRSRVARENALRSFYELAEDSGVWDLKLTPEELAAHRGAPVLAIASQLARLRRAGLVSVVDGRFRLTDAGLKASYEIVRNHRLWEMFLMHEGQLGADHVDRDADTIEHHLNRDTVAELERLLRVHGREPELPPSVHPVRI